MITEIRNGLNVKRFHTTHRTQEETVGHHSCNVAAILLRLDPLCSRDLLVAALMHDVAEVYTGDVPAPFKWDNPHVKQGLDDGEDDYVMEHSIPDPEISVEGMQLLKFADMLDLVLSSLEEMGRGNSYAKQLVENGANYLSEMPLWEEYGELADTMVREVKDQWNVTTRTT